MMKQSHGTKSPITLRRLCTVAAVLLLFALVFAAPAAAEGNVAKIGTTEYSTLAAALAATENMGGAVTITLLGDATWETGGTFFSTPLVSENSKAIVTIDGQNHNLTATGQGLGSLRAANGEYLTFMNMVIADESTPYAGTWNFIALEFAGNITCTNVEFKDGILMRGDVAKFESCTFQGASEEYGVFIQNGDATFTECTFNGERGLKLHEEYSDTVTGVPCDVGTILVDKCTFKITKKPGIAIGDVSGNTVTIKDSTFDGVTEGDQYQYSYESDTELTAFTLERSGNTFVNVDLTNAKDLDEGTYSDDVSSYVATGYRSHNNEDGTWTVKEITYHTVKWANDDGTVLETDEDVAYGTTPTYDGATPTKKADAQYTYTFKGWEPAVEAVTGDITYTAIYDKAVNTYTITWKSEDGTVLETDKDVPYGEMPSYNGAVPTKDATETHTYTFKGWKPTIVTVVGDAEYLATEFIAVEIPKTQGEAAPIQPVVQAQAEINEVTGVTTITTTAGDNNPIVVKDEKTAKITDATGGVTITVSFESGANLPTGDQTSISGKVESVEAAYKQDKAEAAAGAGEIQHQLTINLKNLTTALPKISPEFKPEVKQQAAKHDKDFITLAMLTAEQNGMSLDDFNKELTDTQGVKITFTVEKSVIDRYGKDNIRVMHLKGESLEETLTPSVNPNGDYYELTVHGNGFSNYVLGVKETVQQSSNDTPKGSSVWLTESQTPTQTPSEQPTEKPTDVAPTDVPTTQPTEQPKSPGFGVLAVLAGLGAVAVLRRK